MKISKSKIIYLVVLITYLCFDWFIMTPHINKKYLASDIPNFEFYWEFIIVSFIVVYVSLILYSLKTFRKTIFQYFSLLIPTVLIVYFFNFLINSPALYFNTNFYKETLVKEYIIIKDNQSQTTILLGEDNEMIGRITDLYKIDLIRKRNKLNSVFDLNNNDSIIVNYRIGFLKSKYLE